MSHKDTKLIKKIVFTTFRDSSIWLKAQNHNQVFWKFLENTSLYDSYVSVFSRFRLGFENHQTSLSTVAKLVSEISEDVEIILPVNMIQAEQIPVPGGRAQRVVLNEDEARATLMSFVENSGTS